MTRCPLQHYCALRVPRPALVRRAREHAVQSILSIVLLRDKSCLPGHQLLARIYTGTNIDLRSNSGCCGPWRIDHTILPLKRKPGHLRQRRLGLQVVYELCMTDYWHTIQLPAGKQPAQGIGRMTQDAMSMIVCEKQDLTQFGLDVMCAITLGRHSTV